MPNDTIPAAENIARLYEVKAQLNRYFTEVIDNGIELDDNEWAELLASTTAARDAYYHGLRSFATTADPHVKLISSQIDSASKQLENLQVSQANAEKALTLVASLAGLASKLLVLGAI